MNPALNQIKIINDFVNSEMKDLTDSLPNFDNRWRAFALGAVMMALYDVEKRMKQIVGEEQ